MRSKKGRCSKSNWKTWKGEGGRGKERLKGTTFVEVQEREV
jgi:hypothetical protein